MNRQILKHIWRYLLMILILVLCIKIYHFSSQCDTESEKTSHTVTRVIVTIIYPNITEQDLQEKIDQIDPFIRKITHFSIYALLGFLTMNCLTTWNCTIKTQGMISLGYAFLYACSDEFHQRFVPGRSGEFRDVGIDTLGAFCGILLALVIISIVKIFLRKRPHSRAKKKIFFIASTGGHLNELLQVKELFSKYDYHIITEKTEVDKSLKDEYQDKMKYLIYGTKKYLFKYIFKFIANCLISLFYYFRFQPDVIVTTRNTYCSANVLYCKNIWQ